MGVIEDSRKRREIEEAMIAKHKALIKDKVEVSPHNRLTFVESEDSLHIMDGDKALVSFLFSGLRIDIQYRELGNAYQFKIREVEHWEALGDYLLSILGGEE